jgi:pSer/pThr/pTyr-binding forkhead associated (FHA) protein
VAVFETPVGINPVVGWLVSRKGSYFGQGFELHSGQNSVGRSLDMDVPLPQDAAIERIRHCMVIFEPQRQDFFLQVEGRSGPVYLNDERVTQNRLLQKRDVIRLGGSELVFFPLCCEAFSWQEVLTT